MATPMHGQESCEQAVLRAGPCRRQLPRVRTEVPTAINHHRPKKKERPKAFECRRALGLSWMERDRSGGWIAERLATFSRNGQLKL